MILSSLGGILLAPTASASVSGDMRLQPRFRQGQTSTCQHGTCIHRGRSENSGFFYNSESRSIEWFVCEGFQTETDCYNDREDYGIGSIEPLAIGASLNYSFNQPFNSFGDEGPYTLFIDS